MKVTVYQGDNFVLTNEHVLKQAAGQPVLAPVLVLVPDRFTLQAERFLLKQRPNLLNLRVVTFSMLYRLVSEELNHDKAPVEILDKTSAVLNLWTAIREVQGELTWFKTSAGHYDFAEKMFNTINQIRSSCVDFASLEGIAKTAVAKKKYHDINLIYQAYCRILGARTDTSGMLEYLLAHASESSLVQSASIFVCGFASLSPARLQVLSALCRTAKQVNIAASEVEFSNQLAAYPHYQIQAQPFTPQVVKIRQETERGEATIIVEKIVSLLAQGVSSEDIVVLLIEFDTLAPVWQVVADKYHLPVNLDVGTKLSTLPEAKYLRDLLELLANDDTENTVAVLFNQYSGIDDATAFDLENKIIKAGLRAGMVPEIKKLSATKDAKTLCEQLKQFTTNEKLQKILDQIIADYTQPFNLRELINLFWTLCSATKVSNIPQYIDRVLIAPVNDWVPTRVQHLFIANCTLDNFPQGQNDDDILQEADLVGTQITPTPSLQRERNFRHAELLKTVSSVNLTLSGTCDDDEFVAVDYKPYNSFLWPEEKNAQFYQTPITVGQGLFFPDNKVKTTLIEKYYDCPRLNFVQNGLRLRPRPLHELQANTVGSAIHVAIENFFKYHDLNQAIAVGIKELDFNYPPLTKNLAKEMRFILLQLEKIFATGQFKAAPQMEADVERPLQHGLKLVGRVDRLDVTNLDANSRAFMVLDFKTGNVSGSVARNIYLGNKLQLPVYSSALIPALKRHAQDNVRIAGAAYLPLSSGYAVDEKQFTIKGFVNKDLMDLFPPALLKPKARYYLDEGTVANMCWYADQLVAAAVEKILAGNVTPQAVEKSTCQYCPLKTLCPQAEINSRWEQEQKRLKQAQAETDNDNDDDDDEDSGVRISFKIFNDMKEIDHE